jgi:hypothetical protein
MVAKAPFYREGADEDKITHCCCFVSSIWLLSNFFVYGKLCVCCLPVFGIDYKAPSLLSFVHSFTTKKHVISLDICHCCNWDLQYIHIILRYLLGTSRSNLIRTYFMRVGKTNKSPSLFPTSSKCASPHQTRLKQISSPLRSKIIETPNIIVYTGIRPA